MPAHTQNGGSKIEPLALMSGDTKQEILPEPPREEEGYAGVWTSFLAKLWLFGAGPSTGLVTVSVKAGTEFCYQRVADLGLFHAPHRLRCPREPRLNQVPEQAGKPLVSVSVLTAEPLDFAYLYPYHDCFRVASTLAVHGRASGNLELHSGKLPTGP